MERPVFDPRAKLALVVSVVVLALVTASVPRATVLFAGFAVFVALTGGLAVGTWLRSMRPVFYLLPVLLVLNSVFYASGAVLWSTPVGPFEPGVTAGGIQTAVLIAVRLLVVAGAAAWFAGTTRAEAFEVALVRLGVPWSGAFLLSLTLRLVPEMRRRFWRIEEAQRARGLDVSGGPISRTKARLPMFLPFLVAVIRYGYELSEALTARGFDDIGERTAVVSIAHRQPDYLLYLLAVGLLVLSLR